jgi:hypothetical protein
VSKHKDAPNQIALFSNAVPIGSATARLRRALFIPAFLIDESKKRAHLYGEELTRAHAILHRWRDLAASGALAHKETSLDAEFLREVFTDALGYASVTTGAAAYQLERQFTVREVGTADGALGTFTVGQPALPVVLIEIKSADTNLDTDRSSGRPAVRQLWDYLNAMPECPWGILSNLISFRLYHRDQGSRAFELFTLDELKDQGRFREFYHLFGPGGLLPTRSDPTPRAAALLARTGERQREVGDELYETYSAHRLELIHHLHTKLGQPLDAAIASAQKLLDRIIFVAFCEDRGLLPRKTIERIWHEVPPVARVTNPRWRNFLDLFRAVDKGHREFDLEQGYNGGLFAHAPEVDDLQLEDSWTDFFRSVGNYDFRDEVNVEVLGHLFEKSVTELEKIRAGGLFGLEVTGGAPPAAPAMPKSAQRKRFGIYYTPPEFTDFLVRQTVGELLRERFADLAKRHGVLQPDPRPPGSGESEPRPSGSGVREGEAPAEPVASAPRGRRSTPDDSPAALAAYYRDCLTTLRNLKICDPACGSGAFLIRAYDYLEEQYADVIDNLLASGDRAAEALADQIPDLILTENLFGVDLSPEAVEITQLALWIRSARREHTLANLSGNIVCGNSLVDDPAVHPRAMKWAQTFPAVFGRSAAGFDCVIGNPPWERLKLQEREFFSLSAPDIAAAVNAADRRRLIGELEKKNPELYARYTAAQESADRTLGYTRTSGHYPLTGKGDINTYVLFAELARSIVAADGRVGLLVPSGIASDDTTKEFFSALMGGQSLVCLYDFENKRPFFTDVHRSFKFSALVFGGANVRVPAADFVFFAHDMDDLKPRSRHIALSAADMALVNPNTHTCPVFRSRRDAELTKAIYRRVPILIDHNRQAGGNPWGISFVRMFDQTNDAELFRTADQLAKEGLKLRGNRWQLRNHVFLPLYEAKMVQAYDHRAAGVVIDPENWVRQGQTVETSLVSHQNPEFVVQPRWWVDQACVCTALGDPLPPGVLCYKDVTSPTNERTMIAAFMPPSAVVNSAPLVILQNGITWRLRCCLLGNLNSFALDFIARQKVGGVHLNFFIVEQLPVLHPDVYAERCPWKPAQTLERWISDRVLKLTCTANDMLPLAEAAGFKDGVHKWKPDERAQLKAELDAAYFHLYGINRDDAEYILSTFSGTQRRDTAETGGYRTAELILAAYDEFER